MVELCQLLVDKRKYFIRLIHRYEKDYELAQEVMSQATIHILTTDIEKFEGKKSLEHFVGAVIMNVARDHAALQANRRRIAPIQYGHEDETSSSDEPSARHETEASFANCPQRALEAKELLSEADKMLPALERKHPVSYQAWRLHVIEEKSYDEIALIQNVPVKVARNQVWRFCKAIESLAQQAVTQ
ncbi:hypothetical protein LC612_43025 [Nostoc sp. CHAB 5834]|nr:hypothetical protein [Nostoc sp. CHAB 5834]